MRFMVIVKASKDTEAGVMPSTELLAAMGKFNEELVKAGVMEAGEGLHPTSKGARIKYQGGQGSASRGPFPLSGDLVAGFWLINTKSRDEARAVPGWRRGRNSPGVRGGRFRRSAHPRTARTGRAAARASGEEVRAHRQSGRCEASN